MKSKFFTRTFSSLLLAVLLAFSNFSTVSAQATTAGTTKTGNGATGLTGTIPSPPPQTAPTISTPSNGRAYTTTPIDVSGLCTTGLLVKLFSNNIFVGAAQCENGNYRMQIDLFNGDNQLVARIYDALDQAGPDSNTVTVNYKDSTFSAFGERISLTSSLAKNGAPVGTKLTWPIILSGGAGPYAVSIDWGDGSAQDLKSISFVGPFDISHTYKTAGIYRIIVKATDANGNAAFLQIVGVGSGPVSQKDSAKETSANTVIRYRYIWWPVLLLLPFAIVAFVIGRRYELVAIHKRLQKQAAIYQSEIQR